jgi:hypothetical protein
VGLDLYAGSLTRYYARDWETAAERAGREKGMPVTVVRPEPDPDELTDPAEIREVVLRWREGVNEALAGVLDAPIDWDESPEAPYFTDRPTWEGYSSLLLWAAYAEHPDLRRPRRPVEDWTTDPALAASRAPEFRTEFPSLLRDTEIWLPSDFRFGFATADVTGRQVAVGSAHALRDELADLNRRTWDADPETVARWRRERFEDDSPLPIVARFGFAVFSALAEAAVANRLVLKTDW